MATIGDLVVKISLNSAELESGISNVNSLADQSGSKFSSLGGVLGGLASGGLAIAAAGFVALGAAAVGAGTAAWDMASQVNQAQNDLVAGLGVTEAEAERLGDVAVEVFRDNFGGSIEEATAALTEARRQLGDLSDTELKDATENAFRLADSFGVDVAESLSTIRTLTDEFGLSQQEAFDLIASGFQRGLNNSGDFLDSIGEYSNLFAQSGADAGEFFSILETGLAGGVLGTDKVADLFKEFSIRVVDGSKTTTAALEALSGPTEDILQKIRDGTWTTADAFTILKDRISDLDDPIEQQALGVALFGTQWEDLGTKAVLGIDASKTALGDLAGATDSLNAKYQNFGAQFEGLKRQILVALIPVGETMMQLATEAFPVLQTAAQGAADFIAGPGLAAFQSFIAELRENAGPAMLIIQDAIARITEALGINTEGVTASGVALTILKGIFDALITAFQLGAIVIHGVAVAVEAGRAAFDAIKAAIDRVRAAWSATGDFVNRGVAGWRSAFGSVQGAISAVASRFSSMASAARNAVASIPDWLRPGSPPPFATGMEMIAKSAGRVANVLPSAFEVGSPAAVGGIGGGLAAVGGGGGGTPVQVVVQYSPVISTADSIEVDRKLIPLILRGLRKAGVVIGGQ